jgi:hypothetical protein
MQDRDLHRAYAQKAMAVFVLVDHRRTHPCKLHGIVSEDEANLLRTMSVRTWVGGSVPVITQVGVTHSLIQSFVQSFTYY